jgi:hypothetical protein
MAFAWSFHGSKNASPSDWASVGGHDQIRFQAGDLLHLNPVIQVQHNGFGAAELRLRPRPHAEWLVAEPIGHRDRDDSQCQQVVLSGEAGAHHPLGRLGDGRLTERVRDGERAVAAAG